MALSDWLGNVRRLSLGRPVWNPSDEYSYYRVSRENAELHRRRQNDYHREAYSSGLGVMRALGILDTEWLAGKTVLDIGAGECMLSEAVAFPGGAKEVWALDATPKQIWAAAERYAGSDRLRFVIGDAQSMPFHDGAFDLVVANLVLHHIHPLDGLLREIARVLAPGGLFAAFEPNPLVSVAVHAATSPNEAPIAPRVVERAVLHAGLTHEETTYWWSRASTSMLRRLSPGFRVRARKQGSVLPRASTVVRGTLERLPLRGLQLDGACSFRELALEQAAELSALVT